MIKRIMLTASEGMILTDGETYGTTIYLAEGADENAYYEITEEEFNAMQEAEAAANMPLGFALNTPGIEVVSENTNTESD